jgi:hypothetical protein
MGTIETHDYDLPYKIDGNDFSIKVSNDSEFGFGEDVCLSKHFNDLTMSQAWYDQGFTVVATKPFFNIKKVKARLTELVHQTLTKEGVKVEKDNFSLESYHKYVSEENHQAIIKKTRRLEPKYFDFDIDSFSNAIRTYFNCNLSWTTSGAYNPGVITRINMPQSNNFNPAHKDIYQVYDQTKKIPHMVNIWIPICGVGNGVGLPVVPRSHLINESKICRTKAGSNVNGYKYNVNCIKDWGSHNELVTISPAEDEMIFFSSFLIHGLARNLHKDLTRVSLEFRLFVQS